MDGKTKRGSKNAASSQGNATSEYSDIVARALRSSSSSCQDRRYRSRIQEEDLAFGVPNKE